jgi:uncharacterized protein
LDLTFALQVRGLLGSERQIRSTSAFILALLLCWAQAALADVAVPPLTGRVVDTTNTLSSSDNAAQSSRLQDLQRRKGSQIAVLIVPTTAPETIEQFSLRAAETWKIGRKKIDDGALLVVAKDDHKLRIEVGYGLEGALTDVTARRIIDETIVPRFRSGDFSGGIAAGLTRMIGVIDGEPLPAPAPEASHGSNDLLLTFLNPLNPFTLFFLFALGAISRSLMGRLIGSVVTGGTAAWLTWYTLSSLGVAALAGSIVSVLTFFAESLIAANQNYQRTHRGSGGWSSGSSSGWSGGGWSSGSSSSSSDSGFSGGGGSFGGGGASGSW